MRRMPWLLLFAVSCASAHQTLLSFQQPAPTATPTAVADSPQPVSSKIWTGRYAEFEEFLRTAEIERTTNVSTGVLGIRRGYFKPGGVAASAAMRSIKPGKYDGFFESYKGDIAAYRLDRLLELDMVPPTIERRYNGEMVSVQLWGSNLKMLKDVQAQKLHATDINEYSFQLRRQKVFQDLTGNIDPNQGNILFDPLWNVILVDFSRAFTNSAKMVFAATTIDRPFLDRIKKLDHDTLKREIGPYVESGGVEAVLSRRDEIVKAFEQLAKRKGERQVFLP